MYKVKPEDVYFEKWHEEGEKDYLVSRAVIYLIDDSTPPTETVNNSFGTRRSVSVHKDASPKIKRQALEFARDHLLDTFDIESAAKGQNFGGNLDKLQAIDMASVMKLFTIEDAINS